MIRTARKLIILVVGLTVILIGIALIVLPGPAIVLIPAGLGILALEFAWAHRLLTRFRETAAKGAARIRSFGRPPKSS